MLEYFRESGATRENPAINSGGACYRFTVSREYEMTKAGTGLPKAEAFSGLLWQARGAGEDREILKNYIDCCAGFSMRSKRIPTILPSFS